eukprot:524495-Pleurochrysis_carterae.AAC.4
MLVMSSLRGKRAVSASRGSKSTVNCSFKGQSLLLKELSRGIAWTNSSLGHFYVAHSRCKEVAALLQICSAKRNDGHVPFEHGEA